MEHDIERIKADRDALSAFAMPAVDVLMMTNIDVRLLPYGVQMRIAVGAALAVLLQQGVITVTPQDTWPWTLPRQVPEELRPAPRLGFGPPAS